VRNIATGQNRERSDRVPAHTITIDHIGKIQSLATASGSDFIAPAVTINFVDTLEKIEEEIGEVAEALSVEEIANTITHGFGLALSVVGFGLLLTLAVMNGDTVYITASAIYGMSLVLLYAASTFYHGARSPRLKNALHMTDVCGIYLLTAGTYTPFGLVSLRGSTLGWTLFIVVWALAISFIILRFVFSGRFSKLWVVSYLLLGWIGVAAIGPLLAVTGFPAIALIIAGGVAYSLGVIFYAAKRVPHNHAIWHVFVMAGSVLHYLAIILYVKPV
jgi:hemolysin III